MLDLNYLKKQHKSFLKKHEDAVSQSAVDAQNAALVESTARQGFNNRTGKTKAATKVRIIKRGKKRILVSSSNTRPHAAVLEKGSKPHEIVARRAKALRFVSGGQVVFRRKVKHPGTRAYKFLSRGRDKGGDTFGSTMEMRMKRISRLF